MTRILWIAPHLNHYKSRLISRLASDRSLEITILSGCFQEDSGHQADSGPHLYRRIHIDVPKSRFHRSLWSYSNLLRILSKEKYDTVLMPLERKHLPLIVFLSILRLRFRYRLVSYNHPLHRTAKSAWSEFVLKGLYRLYDRIVFYTQQGMEESVARKLIHPSRAFFSNNTLDTKAIWEHYSFDVNTSSQKRLLFIGRLTQRKRLDLLLEYFQEFQCQVADSELVIIGDGPEAPMIRQAILKSPAVSWKGLIVDEAVIAGLMRGIHAVFVPGDSGLSIVHAFAYGKPYITMASNPQHGPEIDYLRDDVNGLLLTGARELDCRRIAELLHDQPRYEAMCRSAFNEAQELGIENWCEKIKSALTFLSMEPTNPTHGCRSGIV